MAKKTSKADALKKAGKVLSKHFKVSPTCSRAGSTLATDSLSTKKKSAAGSKLASIHQKPHCKARGQRTK